jgi:hypothetical protein
MATGRSAKMRRISRCAFGLPTVALVIIVGLSFSNVSSESVDYERDNRVRQVEKKVEKKVEQVKPIEYNEPVGVYVKPSSPTTPSAPNFFVDWYSVVQSKLPGQATGLVCQSVSLLRER